ncbi:50S ribosomal protein L19e [Candidatus Bathyarchaeota archaeon]|nr:MAG: 50S ribosomal protein L19e [Candidatus Bathyarchaeota archaeon]
MDLKLQRRLAAEVLDCGINRVWLDPTALDKISEAATKEDIRKLVEEGLIKRKQVKGVCRVRINWKKRQKRKGRRRGHGSRKGKKGARASRKRLWINRIRVLRRRLKYLRDKGLIDRRTYRVLYRKAKGGEFRSLSHLNSYLISQGIIKE